MPSLGAGVGELLSHALRPQTEPPEPSECSPLWRGADPKLFRGGRMHKTGQGSSLARCSKATKANQTARDPGCPPPSPTRCLQAALPHFQVLKPRDRERGAELTAGWAALPYPTPRLWRALPCPHLAPAWLSGQQTHGHVAPTCVPTAPCRRTNSGFGLILFKEGLSSEPFPAARRSGVSRELLTPYTSAGR